MAPKRATVQPESTGSLSVSDALSPFDDVQTPQSTELKKGMTYDNLAEITKIPAYQWQDLVDISKWREKFVPHEASEKQLQTYFARTMTEAIWMEQDGDDFLGSYISDFNGWRIDEFDKIDRTLQKEMLRVLKQRGIPVQGRSLTEKLANLVNTKEIPRTIENPSQNSTITARTTPESSMLQVPYQQQPQMTYVHQSVEEPVKLVRPSPEYTSQTEYYYYNIRNRGNSET